MREFGRQFKTLLKKNLLLKGKCSMCCEIVFPLCIIGVLFALLGIIMSFEADYDKISANTFSYRVNNETKLIYGSEDGTLNNDQLGVINSMKEQVATIQNLSIQDVDVFFLEINNRDDMENYFKNYSKNVYGGVWFNSTNNNNNNNNQLFKYNIRLDSEDTADTSETKGSGDSSVYLSGNFESIQVAMDQAIFTHYGINKSLNVWGQHYPNPYTKQWQKWNDARNAIIKSAGSVFVTISLIVFNFRLVTDLVIEKETKIREAMKMMGLNSLAYMFSWIVTSLIIALPIDVIIAIVFKSSQIIYATNWGVVILIFVLYLITLLLLAFIFSIFFDSSKFCGIISFIIIIAINVAGVFVAKEEFSVSAKLILSLFSPISFSCAMYTMSVKDLTMVLNVNWKYIPTNNQNIMMLGIDCIFYLILIWYLEKVVPSEYGSKEKWYFPVSKSYWFKNKKIGYEEVNDIEATHDSEDVERIPLENIRKATISIRNLRKEYETGDGLKVAVNDLHLDMLNDQIFAMLGPNGSGKSTTIGMLTGLIKPTNGTAYIHGLNISKKMNQVRPYIGCCLQTDIIWPQLSVLDHLKIYASLKGIRSNQIDKEAHKMANEVDLSEKVNTPAGSLSGGQKRKLCLGIAFIGRSDIIFLDEPTSGMDPQSRRVVWDFLLKYKKGRTIILTSHFLEEADYLGDRIAIIAQGKLRCDGSSLFLKNKFGQGYLLTCSKILKTIDNFDSNSVLNFVCRFVPNANILSDAGAELSIRLPTESLPNFPEFFSQFDNHIERFGILNYGISVTSLEEVFLSIGQNKSIHENSGASQEHLKRAISTNSTGPKAGQQLKGLLIKRIRTSKKDFKSFFLALIIPLAFIIGSIVLYKTMSEDINLVFNNSTVPLTMSLSLLGDDLVPMQAYNQTNWQNSLNSSPYFNQFKFVPESENFHDYLIENYKESGGAINFTSSNGDVEDETSISYISLFNNDCIHSLPIHVNLINDALLRKSKGIGIEVTSWPFAHVMDNIEKLLSDINPSAILYFIFILTLGFSLMSGSFAGNVAQERTNRIKRLLYISGCKKHIYWLSNLVWDLFFAFILCILTSSILAGVMKSSFKDQFGISFISLILLSISIIPLGYLFSYKFASFGKAVGAITCILFSINLIFIIASINVRIQVVVNQDLTLQKVADIIDLVMGILSPVFAYSRILFILSGFPGSTRLGSFKIDNYWSLNYTGTPLIILLGHCVVWTVWILVLDYIPQIRGYLKNPKNTPAPQPPIDEDQDVSLERTKLASLSRNSDVLQIRNLHKVFPGKGKNPTKVAVNNTTLSVPKGCTFGLLGMNGAGKTTTLSMLAGEFPPSSGEITLNGYDLITDRENALSSISSCFQFDALVSLLSAREQLWLYSRIKGIEESKINEVVEAFITMMDLTSQANSNTGGYSGGNKRKVSLSIAMLGNPSIVYLDEPSSACDAVVKRFMWNVISELGKDKVIMLTTHSMAEVDALCHKITVMRDGKLTCLGSIQHVKSRFGGSYSVDVKFKKNCSENGIETILSSIPNSILLDHHDLMANFEIENSPINPIKVSEIFSILSNLSQTILDDYNVGQTSLESVFLKLTGTTKENRLNLYED